MTVEEINAKIQELRNLCYEAEKKEIESFKKDAKKNVGRCFIVNGSQYVKVIDVPREKATMTGISFNQYQYPALYLTTKLDPDDIVPFSEDTLFSGAWGEGCDSPGDTYQEITMEEFDTEFNRRINEFKNVVLNAGDRSNG